MHDLHDVHNEERIRSSMTNANIELSPALVAELANYSEADRNALLEVLEDRSSQLSVTFFQQITQYFNFSCFLTY
jgi:hypothetical protein